MLATLQFLLESFSDDLEKWFSLGKFSLFVYQPMNEKIKTWTLSFPAKENLNNGEVIVRSANRVAVCRQSEVSINF